MITLEKLNRNEAVRYLGGAGISLNYRMDRLMDECEKEILEKANPKFLYTEIDLPNEEFMQGKDIENHLSGCRKAIVMCATLGAEIDKLIRISQIADMAKAVVIDSFASVAIEQVCSKADELIAEKYPDCYMTFRFSPGYGDYPIGLQQKILTLLDAPRKIGLTTNESCLLIPSKSVTAVMGLSDSPIERRKRGCAVCNMRDKCKYRRNGEHCGF
ncbi:MAG: vitamin B12 dependent-methionine synthase activation domain-containing protein [Ruminococcus sp.]|nr:vitamin B12 dependent-methionine synthase activation domain-containing protein [Ruminococcus sp.]